MYLIIKMPIDMYIIKARFYCGIIHYEGVFFSRVIHYEDVFPDRVASLIDLRPIPVYQSDRDDCTGFRSNS